MGVSLIGISTRSYIAAGLVTAITGATMTITSPMMVQRKIQPPTVSSTNVKITIRESWVAVAMAADAVVDLENARETVDNNAAVGPSTAMPAAANAVGGPVAQKVALTALAQAARVVSAVSPEDAMGATADYQYSAVVADAGPDPAKILGVPLLIATLAVDIVANSAEAVSDASFGIGNILAGVAIQDPVQIQLGLDEFREIPGDFGHLVFNFETHLGQIAAAFGFRPPGVALPRSIAPTTDGVDTLTASRPSGVTDSATDNGRLANTYPNSPERPDIAGTTNGNTTRGNTSIGDAKTSKPSTHSTSTLSNAERNKASFAVKSRTEPDDRSVHSGRASAPSSHADVLGVKHSRVPGPKRHDAGTKGAKGRK
jgi:hypothetical protein